VNHVSHVVSRPFVPTLLKQVARRNRTRLIRRLRTYRDTPWMRPAEEDLLRDLLTALRPRRCLEWGGGLSTVQFPALLPADATWTAIEHDAGWARTLAGMVTRPGTTVRQVPPDDLAFVGDGDAVSFARYLEAADAGAPYDFIFIDGRARAAALTRAHGLLAPGGVVVLHDANRDAYLGPATRYPHQLLFRDRRAARRKPAGGVWIGSVDRDPATLIDAVGHRRLWTFYSGLGGVFA
jgi:predicted O-methyltransferase YrrM